MLRSLVLLPLLVAAARGGEVIQADVVVYSATAGGATASVAAARHGAKVVLVEPGNHVGGMLSGGLGHSDVHGQADLIGGLAYEVYERMAGHYKKKNARAAFNFEPHVAENALRQMLAEVSVPIKFGERVESVEMDGARIVSFTTQNGNTYVAKVFIDSGYEGDLMAKAGVKYTVGREGRKQYDEWLAGRTDILPGQHQFRFGVAAHRDGQLLPFITPQSEVVATGEGDGKFQGYCFRLCLTDNPQNQIAITQPDGYNPDDYELLRRYFQEGADGVQNVLHTTRLPNGKCDVNSSGPVSTILLGAQWDYPDANYKRRKEIWQQHLRWAHGLMWFMQNDESVPTAQQESARKWGLCKDEFVDLGGWPHQMYIREGRRMLGEYVVTQHDLEKNRTKSDGVGMCGYNIDLREVQWVALRTYDFPNAKDKVYTEGYVSQPVKPWQIPYRALTPKQAECENLLVSTCASMSTVAYGSFRMEPGYMISGHACGLAAALAARSDLAVQAIDCERLRELLRDQGQVVEKTTRK